MELNKLTANGLKEKLAAGKASAEEIADCLISRVNARDKDIGAYVYFDRDDILARALKAEKKRGGKLQGVPVAVKDNICVKGQPTTCASKILKGFAPPYNATVIEKLEREGAYVCGKTNMDEFAFGSSTESSSYKITHNPWDISRVPGGSSGGSAAAVASDEAVVALGSDTGGSIRQPAGLCGVVGMKPTYGRVSRYGLIAFASSLDQIGPITKDVSDCALLLNVIAGHDEMDSTSASIPVPDYMSALAKDVKGLNIGMPHEYFIEGLEPDVKDAVAKAVDVLRSLGARIEKISLPHTEYAVAAYYIIAPAEASSNLARYDGVQYGLRAQPEDLAEMYNLTRSEGFGPEAKRRVILGTYVLSSGYYDAYYLRALKVRTLIKRDFDDAFKRCDCIVTPTSPAVAFKIGEKKDDPLSMYLSDIFTISANLAGIPAISIPCGFSKEGLPVGLQILGRPFDEATILRAAYAYEQNTEWHRVKPK